MSKKKLLLTILFFFFFSAGCASAETIGQARKFFIEPGYDSEKRTELTAVLINITPQFYVYADEKWWASAQKDDVNRRINELGNIFNSEIYPKLTGLFGTEWNPGIDKDQRMTLLLHPMWQEAGGYFRSNDEYPKIQITNSNEREMIYINSENIQSPMLKSFLAHEFVHLISFNQKENKNDISEDVWLNEARAEYAPTFLGYNDIYPGSYLEKRVQYFVEKPSGSLVDWQNTKFDYARANLFAHYLVDYYGINILTDSLKSNFAGIDSINYALVKNGFKQNLAQIFSDWTVAVLVNDCTYGAKYCYVNASLKKLNILPQVNYLPVSGESTLTFAENTKYWSGNWYKIIGGSGGKLKFNFVGEPSSPFKVYYIVKTRAGSYSVNALKLTSLQKGEVAIPDFGGNISSLYIITHLEDNKNIKDEYTHSFSWSASMAKASSGNEEEINRLLAIIEELKQKIADLLAGKQAPLPQVSCQITSNLSQGMKNDQVKCLQEFLKSQPDIYPEGYITGIFGQLTKNAVVKFQEKYASEILAPSGLSFGTGYVGSATRQKIEQCRQKN